MINKASLHLNLVRRVRLLLCLAVCLPLVLVSFVVPLKNVSAVDIEGNDHDNGDDGNDLVIGSFANSSMSIKDLAADTLTCGTGNDTAFINISDNDTASADCETVIISP